MTRERAGIADVGVATRRLVALSLVEGSETERRVVLALVHEVATWSRLADRIATRRLAAVAFGVAEDAVTGWQRRRVSNVLLELHARRWIDYQSGTGRSSMPIVSIVAHGPATDAETSPQGEHVLRTFGPGEGDQHETPSRERCAPPARKVSTTSAKGEHVARHTEKSSEEIPESSARASVVSPLHTGPAADDDRATVQRLANLAGQALTGPTNAQRLREQIAELLDSFDAVQIETVLEQAKAHGDVRSIGWVRQRLQSAPPPAPPRPSADPISQAPCTTCDGSGLEPPDPELGHDPGTACSTCAGRGTVDAPALVMLHPIIDRRPA